MWQTVCIVFMLWNGLCWHTSSLLQAHSKCCTAGVSCVGRHIKEDMLKESSAQCVQAQQMHTYLSGLLEPKRLTSLRALMQHQDIISGSCASRESQASATGAAVLNFSMHDNISHSKHHSQHQPPRTAVNGFLQEDGLFAYSVSRSCW